MIPSEISTRQTARATAFKFSEFQADKFLEKIYEAAFLFYDKDAWHKLQMNGMNEDNSWENAARKYLALYTVHSL